MDKHKVSINNTGIDYSGITRDYKIAIAELIWNGFDARAKNISIDFNTNAIDTIDEITITDDGDGINLSTIEQTFGNFNDSIKKYSFQKFTSSVRGNKGKGRFSFKVFSGQGKWKTVYKDNGNYFYFEIIIRKNAKDYYEVGNKSISKVKKTGTTVILNELFEVTAYSFSCNEFYDYLAQEFGWFLFLNREKKYSIQINNSLLEYKHIIAEDETIILPIKDASEKTHSFKITYIRWSQSIGDRFYFYFLNSHQNELFKELTSYNNNAINFYHSVFVESDYFDSFTPSDNDFSNSLFDETRSSGVFKALQGHLKQLIKQKQRQFIYGEAAEKLILGFEKNGVIKFKNNKYEQARKNDLINVVKGLYCLEPKIFQGLNKEQQKVSVGLINLLLDTDERENIIEIIGEIVNLTSDDRVELLNILKKTSLNKIAKTINLIETRFKVIELLKHLVFDLSKFTNERDHIQKAIEENYWIFGEQYHLVSANEGFDVLLKKYLDLIEDLEAQDNKKAKIKSVESNRRPDVFVCRKHSVPDYNDSQYLMDENLIVELKRPNVPIGKDQLRQIEDYLDIIINEEQFNSKKRFWKFFLVGNKIDSHIEQQYESEKNKGKRFLVKALNNFEIYVYTWDDIFTMFSLRHKFLVDNLDFDRNALRNELLEKGIDFYNPNDDPNVVTKETIDLSKIATQ